MSQNTDQPVAKPKDRITAALLALFVGGLGVHQFYLGNTGTGVIRLLMTLSIIGLPFSALFSFIEFIIYITKSDEEFQQIYVVGNKSWF